MQVSTTWKKTFNDRRKVQVKVWPIRGKFTCTRVARRSCCRRILQCKWISVQPIWGKGNTRAGWMGGSMGWVFQLFSLEPVGLSLDGAGRCVQVVRFSLRRELNQKQNNSSKIITQHQLGPSVVGHTVIIVVKKKWFCCPKSGKNLQPPEPIDPPIELQS